MESASSINPLGFNFGVVPFQLSASNPNTPWTDGVEIPSLLR